MTARIIDGKAISARIRERVREGVTAFKKAHGKNIGLAVVLVGDNPASALYVKKKAEACEQTGIRSYSYRLPADAGERALLDLISALNADANVHGILIQLPLPKGIDTARVLSAVDSRKDVDGFHPLNAGLLQLGRPGHRSCTPLGCMELLKSAGIDLEGKRAAVVGRSAIVGKPVSLMLLEANATVTMCHSRTADLRAELSRADIIIAAAGQPKLITADMVKPGAVVIDVGINRVDGKLCGDVDFEGVSAVASYITPVPGGVGPMTIAMLLCNTLDAARALVSGQMGGRAL